MNRAELDAAFAAAVKSKSRALADGDTARALAESASILALAREILARTSASGRPAHLTPEQDGALFWAAYHPVRLAPAGEGAAAMIRFADEVEWLRSIGHDFSPKERKVVDGLPFCGVPELFRRWVASSVATGFAPDPAAGARTVFTWLRDRPAEPVPEDFIRFLAENLHLERHWFPFYYGELLTRLGRGAECERDRAAAAREKPTDFRRWVALAESYAAKPHRIVACLAKALTCTILPADRASEIRASLERRLRAALTVCGRTPPRELDAKRLHALAAPTEEFLARGSSSRRGVLESVRAARNGRRLVTVAWTEPDGSACRLELPVPRELERLPVGAAVKFRVARHADGTARIISFEPPRPPAHKSPRHTRL